MATSLNYHPNATSNFSEGFTDPFSAFDRIMANQQTSPSITDSISSSSESMSSPNSNYANKELDAMRSMPSKEDVLMKKLMKFFMHEYNRNQMLPIVYGESEISLRVLDWFVTNYSKQFDIIYAIQKNQTIRHFSVHSSYKSQLKTHSKKQFDPFCRRKRIYFEYDEDEGVKTTIGQLNFFRWAIENKVIDYVKKNLETIIADMNQRGSKSQKTKEGEITEQPHKKRELSVAATKSISQHDVKVVIKFDL